MRARVCKHLADSCVCKHLARPGKVACQATPQQATGWRVKSCESRYKAWTWRCAGWAWVQVVGVNANCMHGVLARIYPPRRSSYIFS